MFVLAPIRISLIKIVCPPIGPDKGPTTTTSSDNGMLAMVPAYPMRIKFEAKEGMQFIEQIGGPGQQLFYQVLVRQLKED